MTRRTFLLLALLAAPACQRPAATPATAVAASAGPAPAATPSCSIESAREVKLADDTELRVWDLKATGLKRLTARLLLATDGKVETLNEIEYTWNQWEPTGPAASGSLVLLVQDGKAFGVKGKRLPQLALDLRGSPSHARTGKRISRMLDGDLQSRVTSSSHTSSLGERNVLYAQLFVPAADAGGTFALGSDPDSVAEASKGGRTVLAVTVDWAPQ